MRDAVPAGTLRSIDAIRADADVASALKFIQKNARRALTAREVVAASRLSRRALERAFRQKIGRTIQQRIRRARTDEIALLLIETNLTVKEICYGLGFPEVGHMARYFRAERQLTPTAFRQAYGRARDGASQNVRPTPGAFPLPLIRAAMFPDPTIKSAQRAPGSIPPTTFASTG